MSKTTQFTIKINGKEQFVELNDIIQTNVRSLGDLKEQQDLLEQAFNQADYGTAEFNQLQTALKDVNSQIKTIDESVEGLTIAEKIQGASQAVGAIGSAFAFATTSIQAFGDENSKTAEELQALTTKILAIQQGFDTLSQLTETFTAKNGLFKRSIDFIGRGFDAAGISAKGFGAVTRAALIATGIGLVTVAISALIANFDKIKAAGSEIFKTWQPFFDGVRNIASTLTFGLIDNANVAKIKQQADDIAASIAKTQEQTTEKLNNINNEFELGTINNITKLQKEIKVLEDNLRNIKNINLFNVTDKLNDELSLTIDRFNEITEFSQNKNLFEDFFNVKKLEKPKNILKDIVNQFNNISDKAKQGVLTTGDIDESTKKLQDLGNKLKNVNEQLASDVTLGSDVFVQRYLDASQKQIDLTKNTDGVVKLLNEINRQQIEFIKKQNELKKAQIEQLKIEAEITKQIADLNVQISLEEEKRSKINNDLLKQGIDLITSFGNILRSPEFSRDLPVFKNLKEQLQFITKSGDFKGIFDDILNTDEAIVNVQDLTVAIQKFRDEQIRLSKLESDARINVLNAEIALNKEKIALETNPRAKDVLIKQNELLKEQINTIKLEVESTIASINVASSQLISSIPRTFEAAKFEEQARQLEIAKQAYEDYKNGLILTNRQAKILFDTLGVDSRIAFDKLDEATKIAVENQFTENLIKQLQELKTIINNLAVTFPELRDGVNEYNDAIDNATKSLTENNKASLERQKNLQQELKLLQEQGKIGQLQTVAARPAQTNKEFEQQRNAIFELDKIQKQQINDRFKLETQGIKETDIRYKISAEKRDQDLDKVTQNTLTTLGEVEAAFILLWANSIATISSSIGQVSDALFQAQTDAVDRQISANQILIDKLSEDIAAIQEQISFVDELINQRKSAIDELQAAAETATGGQREEILKQLDNEISATKELVRNKKALQKQEEDATKRQQKLEKENQILAAKSIVIQQQQAVAAQVLAIAQTGVAIASIAASSAKQDFTFGIATVASIAAVTLALTANIIGISNALDNLNQAKANLSALGGAKGGFPDNFEPMAEGGFTPNKGFGIDKTGEDNVGTYRLHANEWVAPRWMVESPKYGSMIHELEGARKKGFAEGGSPVPLRQAEPNNEQLTSLLIQNLNKPIYVAVTDINDGQNRVQVIENRARL